MSAPTMSTPSISSRGSSRPIRPPGSLRSTPGRVAPTPPLTAERSDSPVITLPRVSATRGSSHTGRTPVVVAVPRTSRQIPQEEVPIPTPSTRRPSPPRAREIIQEIIPENQPENQSSGSCSVCSGGGSGLHEAEEEFMTCSRNANANLDRQGIPKEDAPKEVDDTPIINIAIDVAPIKPVSNEQYNVENILSEHGYTVASKINVRSPGNPTVARYLEANNMMGHRVFIDIDTDGFVAVSPTDLTLYEGKLATVIPTSTKHGMLKCVGNGVCGVAFVCEDGICALQQEGPGAPTETTFLYREQTNDRIARLGDRAIAYPIVRLSEIIENNELVTEIISEATNRIRQNAMDSCRENFRKMQDAIDELYDAFNEFTEVQQQAFTDLSTSITQLEDMNYDYINSPPSDENSQERYKQLMYNLKKRHEMESELIYVCSSVSKKREKIMKWTQHLRNASEETVRDFANVTTILSE